MITDPGKALADLAMKLAISIAPQTTSMYAAADAGLTAMLMQCLAQDYGRAAENRAVDIEEIKELFRSVNDAGQHGDLASFIEGQPESLSLADLESFHAQGLNRLITLHNWAEASGTAELNDRIWAFLARYADRHAFELD